MLSMWRAHGVLFFFFFFSETATTEIYTLSLHDALPIARNLDRTGELNGISEVERNAYDLLLRGVSDAFDLSGEDPQTVAKYDTSHLFNMADYHEGGRHFLFDGKKKLVDQLRWTNLLGKEMLLARRLCEAGCGFVTVVDSSWDFHGGGANNPGTPVGMNTLGAQVDHAVAAFLDDLEQRGMSDQGLLVITGEMGRTPIKRNRDAGTDHHGSLTLDITQCFNSGLLNTFIFFSRRYASQ